MQRGPEQLDLSMTPGEEGNSVLTVDRIRGYIDEHGLREGDRLPTERQFSTMFGVGRRAVRRALEALEAEGAISRRQGAGTFLGPDAGSGRVNPSLIATTNFTEIMEVRLCIETQLAQLAALRAKPADIARMQMLSTRIAESRDADARELWDGMLHRLIAQAAGNSLFLTLFDTVNRIRRDATWQAVRERARAGTNAQQQAIRQHSEIIDSIARKDPVAAAEAMRRHLLMLQTNLLRQTSLDLGGADETKEPGQRDRSADQHQYGDPHR